MSSTSRPQTTGTANIQSGQSPSKSSQVESANTPPNVAQPMYQNNPNQQFIPSNIPLINAAQQLQFQSQLSQLSNLHQTAALIQRQTQLLQQHQQQQQQQQQPNSVDSQSKTQTPNGPTLGSFHNFPELLNFFLLSNSTLNLPLPQLNQTQTMPSVQQQPLTTPKTLPVSPSKLGQSQHTPRSAVTGHSPQSVSGNISNAQTAEVNSATSVTPSATVSDHYNETTKQPLITSPAKSSVSASSVSTPSSTMSDRLMDEMKERTNVLLQAISKNLREDSASSNNAATLNESVQEVVSSPETNKPTLPRRKQTNVTGSSPIKLNPIISPSNPTGPNDSSTFSTPKKSSDVIALPLEVTPAANISTISVPTTPTTPPDKIVKDPSKEVPEEVPEEVPAQKSVEKDESESKAPSTTTEVQKPSTSQESSSTKEPAALDTKSKRNRIKTTLYQSPTPELVLATRISFSEAYKSSSSAKDKLIIFYNEEFLAVRNDEGSFYLCQCIQNIYRTSKKCRVRWLNKDQNSNEIYKLGYYDQIDKECILTSVVLEDAANNSYKLMQNDRDRIDNILKKSIDVENGILPRPEVTIENPDGLDISLYKDESQIKLNTDLSASLKRQAESSPKSVSPSKKVKKNTKTVTPPPNRRKRHSDNNESLQNKGKSSNKSIKKNVVPRSRRSNELTVKSPSIGSKSTSNDSKNVSKSSRSDDSSADSGQNKVAKAKKQKKSSKTSSLSSSEQQRTLRTRSNK